MTVEYRGPRVLLLGPARNAVSGVSTHLNQLFESALSDRFRLLQFQVEAKVTRRVRRARCSAWSSVLWLLPPASFV